MSNEFYFVLPLWVLFLILLITGWVPERGNIYGTKRSKEPRAYWSAILVYFILLIAITSFKFNDWL